MAAMKSLAASVLAGCVATASTGGAAGAHHSFAMYDTTVVYVITGVLTRLDPAAAHAVIHFVPLDDARERIIRDAEGEPWEWNLELSSASSVARSGITLGAFPAGTIISVGVHPLRNGGAAGAIGSFTLFKCPANTPPEPGAHCDTVEGATSHGGDGVLPEPTAPAPLPGEARGEK